MFTLSQTRDKPLRVTIHKGLVTIWLQSTLLCLAKKHNPVQRQPQLTVRYSQLIAYDPARHANM